MSRLRFTGAIAREASPHRCLEPHETSQRSPVSRMPAGDGFFLLPWTAQYANQGRRTWPSERPRWYGTGSSEFAKAPKDAGRSDCAQITPQVRD